MIYQLLKLTNSEVTASGITETEMGQTLLNGNNIAMVRPQRHALTLRPMDEMEDVLIE